MNDSQSEKLVVLDYDDTCFDTGSFKEYINSYFNALLDEVWQNTELGDLPRMAKLFIPEGLDPEQTRDYLKHEAKLDLILQAGDILKQEKHNYSLEKHFTRILDLLEFPSYKTAQMEQIFKEDLEKELIFKRCSDFVYQDTSSFMQMCNQKGYRLLILTQGDHQFQKNKIEYSNLPEHQLIICEGQNKLDELNKYISKPIEIVYVDDKDKHILDFHQEFPYDFAVIMNRDGESSEEKITNENEPNLDYLQVMSNFDELSPRIERMYEQIDGERMLYRLLYPERKMF